MGQNHAAISTNRAFLELLLASFLWGFGFIATRFALEHFDAFWLNALRFILATLVTAPLLFFIPNLRRACSWEQFKLAAPPGLALGIALLFQTYGLLFTLVSKSAFITTLYIIIVPFAEVWILKSKLPRIHWVLVFFSLLGAYLICRPETSGWNMGDLLTLFCAGCSAFQIVELERVSDRIQSAFVFNAFQGIWAGLIPLMAALWLHPIPLLPWPMKSYLGIMLLAWVSTLLAFYIQIRAQRVLRSSTASLLFLLESPFAAAFAYVIFNERMSALQWLGAVTIAATTAIVVYFESSSE